jgi:hypothetical protein
VTDPGYTAIAALMDRSGSMHAVRDDAEGALRAFVADQREVPGRCTIRLAEFDNEYATVYGSTPIADVPDYVLRPRGMTSLLDAIGKLVTDFGAELAAMPQERRPGRVIVVIQTDGHENNSKEWTLDTVRTLITEQREKYAWEFLFLGAGEDAIDVATGLGVAPGSALAYRASGTGHQAAMASMSTYVRRYRAGEDTAFTAEERAAAADDGDQR